MDAVEFAEQRLLGFLLYQPGVLADPYPPLPVVAEDFGVVEHQRIYRALHQLVHPDPAAAPSPTVVEGQSLPAGEAIGNLQYTVDTEGRLVRRGDVEIATLTDLARERMEQRYRVPGVDAVAVLDHLRGDADENAAHPVDAEYLHALLSTAPPLELERPRPDLSYAEIVLDGSIRRRAGAAGLRVAEAFTPDQPLQTGLQQMDAAVTELRELTRRWQPPATAAGPWVHAGTGTAEHSTAPAAAARADAVPTVPAEDDIRAAEDLLIGHALRNPALMGTVFARLDVQDFSRTEAAASFRGVGLLVAADHDALAADAPRPVIDPATVAAQQGESAGLDPEALQACRAAAAAPDAPEPRACADVVLRGHIGRAAAVAAHTAQDTANKLGDQLRAGVQRAGKQFGRVEAIVERWQALPTTTPAPPTPRPVPTPARDAATTALLERLEHRGAQLREDNAAAPGGGPDQPAVESAATDEPPSSDPGEAEVE